MIQCPNCDVGFAADLRQCPACQKYHVPDSDFAEAQVKKAISQLAVGASVEDVSNRLSKAGLSEKDVKAAIARGRRNARRQTRRAGLLRLLIGIAALAAGIVGITGYIVSLRPEGTGGGIIFVTGLSLPIAVFGLFAFASGVWSVVTGRESPLSAPLWVRTMMGDDQ